MHKPLLFWLHEISMFYAPVLGFYLNYPYHILQADLLPQTVDMLIFLYLVITFNNFYIL